jgi:hypothetical protein
MVKSIFGVTAFFGLLTGCNVSPAPQSTGGALLDGGTSATTDGGRVDGGTACGRGTVVVTSDYKSTNIAITTLDGTSVSGSFVSSGATKAGLSTALSGDVDVPFVAPPSKRVVLIDRYGTNVLTWLDLTTADVLAQLPVGTGFNSNPHDYLEVDATRAFVSRYGTNATPGAQAFDQGGDLLIIDSTKQTITGRIAMPEENPALQACPDGMNWIGSEVVVNLGRWSADFSQIGDGRFVLVNPTTNAVDWTVDVTGLQACGRVAVSPSGRLAAIACSSMENTTTNQFNTAESDIVVYDATVTPPKELRRLGAAVKLSAGIQPEIVFATEDAILALTYGGNTGGPAGDTAFTISATTGTITPLIQATMSYVYGGMHCAPGCGDVCILSDAETNTLRRWQVGTDGTFAALANDAVDPSVGLPPRDIGSL